MSRIKDELLAQQQAEMEELDRRYQEHDCHATPDDSCSICEEYKEMVEVQQPDYRHLDN